jgi:glycosyltransferase involved in cell wall biosynthesis
VATAPQKAFAVNADMPSSLLPSVCLFIPTFRRPEGLRRLLAHVELLEYARALTVVVVDNDAAERAGQAVVDEVSPGFPFPLRCVVERQRGQTYAYNRGFVESCRQSEPQYVAVLDDDEFPSPRWLHEMVTTAVACEADLVGGPVFPVFDQPDCWLAKTSLYQPRRYATGRVDMIYGAGSMLIRRDVLERYLDEPFCHEFAFTGGSDLEFFTRCRRDGRSFAWADDAEVFETTPASRTTLAWLLRRHFRKGTDNTRIDRKFSRGARDAALRWYKGLGLIAYGIVSLPAKLLAGRAAAATSLISVARGAGRIAAEFNLLYEEYRVPDARGEPLLPDSVIAARTNAAVPPSSLTIRQRTEVA